MILNWNVSKSDHDLIERIVERAIAGHKFPASEELTLMMDLTALQANGTPLRLRDLLDFPAFDFTHDIYGIVRHIDRNTGQLGGCFVPRCAIQERKRA